MKSFLFCLSILLLSPLICAQNNFSIEAKGVRTLLDLSEDISYWNNGIGGEISVTYSVTPGIKANLSLGYSQFQYSGKGIQRLLIPEEHARYFGEKSEAINLTFGGSIRASNAFITPIFAVAFGVYSFNKGLVVIDVYDVQNVFLYKVNDETTGKILTNFMMNISYGFAIHLVESLSLNVMAGYVNDLNADNILIPLSVGVEYSLPAF